MKRSLAADVEEQLIIPSYASRWASAAIFLHRALSLPLQVGGPATYRSLTLGGQSVALLGVGREKLIHSLCARLFGQLPSARHASRRLALNPAGLRQSGADLIVAEVHRWMAPWFRRAGWLIVPRSVRWHGELATVPPLEPSRSLLANLAKIRKHQFSLIQATSPEDWDEFFSTMVQPQAKERHGPSAWIASSPFLRRIAERGTLHLVIENGVRVAGTCTVPHGETLWFPLIGVRQGDPQLLQRGAGVAALALPIEWARAKGYSRIDLGRTGPFVQDGLQQYKRNWGFLPVVDPLSHVAAVWLGSAEARQAFSRDPVLIEGDCGLAVYAGEDM